MMAPIVSVAKTETLLLQFDLLLEEYIDVQAKIIHCNVDWTKSMYNDIEFLYDYNTFDIRDFEYSINTKTLYVNYWFNLPRVKKSGNYIIQVYQNGNDEDVLFTRRFIAYENQVSIKYDTRMSTGVSSRRMNQQVEFDLVYSQLNVSNPMADFSVAVRQNQRWDTIIDDLKPTAVKGDGATLEYRHFGMENNFKAGNEFRMIDLRSFNYRGAYIAEVDPDANPRTAKVQLSKSRRNESYSTLADQNGGFTFGSNEVTNDYLEYEYINTEFSIRSGKYQGYVYVLGAFNDWSKDDKSRLKYDDKSQTYVRNILLKQGTYDYMYWVDSPNIDPYALEGSHFQTANDYDIIVYYKSFSDMSHRVVGYRSFRSDL